jgi:hexulose-6-phosphate isomerase
MQGRLSPPVDGRIQAFPWDHWRDEFASAETLGLHKMEWTLDAERLHDNPLLTADGRAEARALAARHDVAIASLTADFWMQAPFYKATGAERERRLCDFRDVVDASSEVGIRWIVCPLVDNGRLDDDAQRLDMTRELAGLVPYLAERGVGVAFESDFPPQQLAEMMRDFPAPHFGVNYDSGNSASLGFNPAEEIPAYGTRIVNVHVKDRVLGGTTVPLGEGAANFPVVFGELFKAGYDGSVILQTARARDGDHAGAIARYRDQVAAWIGEAQRGS